MIGIDKKYSLIWLEAAGCSGNIISLLNANNPDFLYLLNELIELKYSNSLMASQGQCAFENFLDTLKYEFILVVDGAVSIKDNGIYNIIAHYNNKPITGMEAVKMAGNKAKYILAVGTCASSGGISGANPNPSQSISVSNFLKDKKVINIPGCPANPGWVVTTVAHLVLKGMPELDDKGRPKIIYGETIHDTCPRRSLFDKGIYAKNLGEKGCMFKLGCRGPITKTDCPIRKWNSGSNWPIGDNTPCIGCANERFPDGMEPFIRYWD